MAYYPTNFYQSFPQQTINGKFVENEDAVKICEIQLGGCGVFPKNDLSEIYVKSWNNNGTIQISTYKLEEKPQEPIIDKNELLLEKIQSIEEKLNTLTSVPKKEVKLNNEY